MLAAQSTSATCTAGGFETFSPEFGCTSGLHLTLLHSIPAMKRLLCYAALPDTHFYDAPPGMLNAVAPQSHTPARPLCSFLSWAVPHGHHPAFNAAQCTNLAGSAELSELCTFLADAPGPALLPALVLHAIQ